MVTVYNNRYMRLQIPSARARAKEAVEIAKSNIRRDARPWELALSMRLIGLADPRVTGI
jgi:hypothetical protein